MTTTLTTTEPIDPRITALARHLESTGDYDTADIGSIEEEGENRYTVNGEEYLVLTDDEAETAWDESMDQYIDECVLGEIPQQFRYYFDYEKFKHDASFDGRGHSLATWDSVKITSMLTKAKRAGIATRL